MPCSARRSGAATIGPGWDRVKATIRDVARTAGVSVATVSRVINASGPVADDTRERVTQAARALRYSPHGAARSLITRRTSTLGVLLPDIFGEFFSEVIRGIDQAARRHGYHLLVSNAHGGRDELAAALRAMRGRVDGLIVMSPDADAPSFEGDLPDAIPVVLLNSATEATGCDVLRVDNEGGARAMLRHLISLGHRRIAHIGGPIRNHDAEERRRAYRAELLAAGLASGPALEDTGDFTESSGYDAVARFLRLDERPTAIFAANDSMAIGAISALREAGVAVPGEMAVVGFDDIPIARYVTPPLTSVHVPIAALGARATALLLQALERPPIGPRRRETLPTNLVVRESCGGPDPPGRARAVE